MQLTESEISALVGAVVVLVTAIAAYLNNQASEKRSATTQNQVAQLQTRVDDVHAVVTGSPPTPTVAPTLVDGHEIPFVSPPPPKLPG